MTANTDLIHLPGISHLYCKASNIAVQTAPPAKPLAFQALQNNNFYLIQMQLMAPPTVPMPAPNPPRCQPAARRIKYVPLAREAKARQDDTTGESLQLNRGPYSAYGSTNDGWRDVYIGRRFVLPAGCAPRRSQRLM